MSDGTPWRPLIHCKDIARAFMAFLIAPRAEIHNQSVNIGGDAENYQVRNIAEIVQRLVPRANVVYTGEIGKDPRDYCVDFAKLRRLLPDFRLQYTLEAGMEELLAQLSRHRFSAADFDGDQFRPVAHSASPARPTNDADRGCDCVRGTMQILPHWA